MKISKTIIALLMGLIGLSQNVVAQDAISEYQQKGVLLCEQGRISEGIVYLDSAKDLAKEQEKWDLYPETTTYYWFAYYQLTGNADTVLHELDSLLQIVHEHVPDSVGIIGNIHLYKGIFNYYNNAIFESIRQSELALDYFEQDRQRYLADIGSIYNNLGVLFSAEGNLYKAEDYIKKAISIKEDFKKSGLPYNESGHLANYLNLSGMYYNQKRYTEFLEYMNELQVQIREVGNASPQIRYQVNQKLARYYLRDDKDTVLAWQYLSALNEIEESTDVEPLDATTTQHLIAEYKVLINDTTTAIQVITESTKKLEQLLGPDAQRMVEFYINVSEFFGRLGYFNEAYVWSNKSLELAQKSGGGNLALMDGQSLQTYSAAVGNLACLYYFDKDMEPVKRLEQVEQLGETYLSSLRVFADRSEKLLSTEGYLDFNTVINALMEVEYTNQGQNPESVFDAMELLELKQGLPLIKNRKDINLVRAAGVSPDLTQKMNDLNIKLAQTRSEYALSNTQEKNSQITNTLVQYNSERDSISKIIKKQISDAGYRLLEPVSTRIDAEQLRLSIGADECLLQYLNDRSELYVVVYTHDYKFIYSSDEPLLNSHILELRKYLSDPEQYNKDSLEWYSHQLYNRLILPFEDKLVGKNLVVMPTGSFNYIPFETLIKDLDAPSTDYLLRHHAVRYLYSLNRYKSQPMDKSGRKSFIAFAPDFSEAQGSSYALRKGYGPLVSAQKEVGQIAKSFPFQTYLSQSANKETFLAESKQSDIIHLATHALINDQNPLYSFIVFADDDKHQDEEQLMFAYELYEMQLDADMAVLSACNTGSGQLTTFDGVISLAKAFEFAGVRSTVMSLWSAQDKATAEIMDLFYKNLAAGDTKSKALQKAKLEYLDQTDPVGAQPFYWAPFILQGDNDPIPGKRTTWPWLLIGALAVLVGLYWVRNSRSKSAA